MTSESFLQVLSDTDSHTSNQNTLGRKIYRKVLGSLPMSLRQSFIFFRWYRLFPRLKKPRTYSERIVNRKLYDHSEAMIWTNDKLRGKKHVSELETTARVNPTFWVGTDPTELIGIDMPEEWVFKPNFSGGSSGIAFGAGRVTPEMVDRLLEVVNSTTSPYDFYDEWGYGQADKVFYVEPRIGTQEILPTDYKVFVFRGKAFMIGVYTDRPNYRGSYYDTDWNLLKVRAAVGGVKFAPFPEAKRPAHLEEMIRDAELIAADFGHLRVDFYDIDGTLWFGETTPYTGSGGLQFYPKEFDRYLGDLWGGIEREPWPTVADESHE